MLFIQIELYTKDPEKKSTVRPGKDQILRIGSNRVTIWPLFPHTHTGKIRFLKIRLLSMIPNYWLILVHIRECAERFSLRLTSQNLTNTFKHQIWRKGCFLFFFGRAANFSVLPQRSFLLVIELRIGSDFHAIIMVDFPSEVRKKKKKKKKARMRFFF